MSDRIVRLTDHDDVRPLLRNRFFICDQAQLQGTIPSIRGGVLLWPYTEVYHVRSQDEIIFLSPEAEASISYLLTSSGAAASKKLERSALSCRRSLRDARYKLPRLLHGHASYNLADYDSLEHLLAHQGDPPRQGAERDLQALWERALAAALRLTQVENKTLGLT